MKYQSEVFEICKTALTAFRNSESQKQKYLLKSIQDKMYETIVSDYPGVLPFIEETHQSDILITTKERDIFFAVNNDKCEFRKSIYEKYPDIDFKDTVILFMSFFEGIEKRSEFSIDELLKIKIPESLYIGSINMLSKGIVIPLVKGESKKKLMNRYFLNNKEAIKIATKEDFCGNIWERFAKEFSSSESLMSFLKGYEKYGADFSVIEKHLDIYVKMVEILFFTSEERKELQSFFRFIHKNVMSLNEVRDNVVFPVLEFKDGNIYVETSLPTSDFYSFINDKLDKEYKNLSDFKNSIYDVSKKVFLYKFFYKDNYMDICADKESLEILSQEFFNTSFDINDLSSNNMRIVKQNFAREILRKGLYDMKPIDRDEISEIALVFLNFIEEKRKDGYK